MERHLERSFYNHAALTPADWSTYCQLASLAHERLGLHVPASALLEHKLSEGERLAGHPLELLSLHFYRRYAVLPMASSYAGIRRAGGLESMAVQEWMCWSL